MAVGPTDSLALIVSLPPYGKRSARSDLDIALAAAALDFTLEVYFLGGAVLQLAEHRNATPALLPSGYRAWASLPELCGARVFAEKSWVERCASNRVKLVMPVEALGKTDMRQAWRQCRQCWVV
jgi:sulfur relay (sulfurtransferase) DsrF/TusC family protein